jgi:UDP-glucuronate 4-epimerase
MKILITGVAGFIGCNLARELIKKYKVVGIDNINSYYSQKLKKDRLIILKNKNFKFYKLNIIKTKNVIDIAKKNKISHIIHLAAQAGVRYSLKFPREYLYSNLLGTFSILECCKVLKIKIFYWLALVAFTATLIKLFLMKICLQTVLFNFMQQQKDQQK